MPSKPQVLPTASSVSARIAEILKSEGGLPICTACGTQYGKPQTTCMICEDPRQAVPASGQTWTSLVKLSQDKDGKLRVNTIMSDQDDERVKFIGTEPGFAINQNPILLEISSGSYIWDCSAYISASLVHYLSTLSKPLKGIAISHPHFFTTSLTWSRILQVPLYLNEADKEWFARLDEIDEGDWVIWWTGEKELEPGLKLIQCGGHFPGSAVMHWDRPMEPSDNDLGDNSGTRPKTGLLLVADTIMVQPTQRGFTFIWSVPNMIPLGPRDVKAILDKVSGLEFDQATSSWPNRFIRRNAKDVLIRSVGDHLRRMGWEIDGAESGGLKAILD